MDRPKYVYAAISKFNLARLELPKDISEILKSKYLYSNSATYSSFYEEKYLYRNVAISSSSYEDKTPPSILDFAGHMSEQRRIYLSLSEEQLKKAQDAFDRFLTTPLYRQEVEAIEAKEKQACIDAITSLVVQVEKLTREVRRANRISKNKKGRARE